MKCVEIKLTRARKNIMCCSSRIIKKKTTKHALKLFQYESRKVLENLFLQFDMP